jgi:hypothetical protein
VLDAGAFKCRTGRTGTGDQPLLRSKHNFSVRADIHEERDLVRFVHARGKHASRDVSADVAGDARQDIYRRIRQNV